MTYTDSSGQPWDSREEMRYTNAACRRTRILRTIAADPVLAAEAKAAEAELSAARELKMPDPRRRAMLDAASQRLSRLYNRARG